MRVCILLLVTIVSITKNAMIINGLYTYMEEQEMEEISENYIMLIEN